LAPITLEMAVALPDRVVGVILFKGFAGRFKPGGPFECQEPLTRVLATFIRKAAQAHLPVSPRSGDLKLLSVTP
jgi:hypothetical protein